MHVGLTAIGLAKPFPNGSKRNLASVVDFKRAYFSQGMTRRELGAIGLLQGTDGGGINSKDCVTQCASSADQGTIVDLKARCLGVHRPSHRLSQVATGLQNDDVRMSVRRKAHGCLPRV